ncbi:hypothetical protein SDC9_80686 [bioreactor metagenome]|uniref:HTH marR-type domain-containing protein n=1 Tax=bioreactor metagenome TaxID=1076179 RepID=A0A644Z7N9_9ZZZZ
MFIKPEYAEDMGRLLVLLYRARRQYLADHLKEYGITGPMHILLMGVHCQPGSSQELISERYFIDKASVARWARRLEELGYLRRETGEEDRRFYRLFLTERGEELVGIVHSHSEAFSRKLTDGLSGQERKTALALLSRMALRTSED